MSIISPIKLRILCVLCCDMKCVSTCLLASLIAESDTVCEHCCGCLLAPDIDIVCVAGCGCGELMHRWNGAQEAANSILPSLLSFITPSHLINQQPPPPPPPPLYILSPSVSFHLCHYCPLSNLITRALYLPLPPPFVCLSLLYPHVPGWLLRPDIKVKSLPPFLPLFLPPSPPSPPLSLFFLPPLTLRFLHSVAILKFLSLPVWPDLFLLFPLLVSVTRVSYGPGIIVIFCSLECFVRQCVRKEI